MRAQLVGNVVEHEALEPKPHAVLRLLTPIKAEHEIWNKVADGLFDLDRPVLRDRQLRHLACHVEDVFGIKVVVGGNEDAEARQRMREAVRFDDTLRAARGLPLDAERAALRFIEAEDHRSRESRRHSGWSALKGLVAWSHRTFEVLSQPLSNFLRERERLTRESHASFKSTRARVHDEISARLPLFAFYRALQRWLVVDPSAEPPLHEGVEVVLVD